MLNLSVVIANYNYAAFVGEAIESALALDWPNVDVVVVDDGSTDGSRDVIARYADRVTVLCQDNAGQLAACTAGFSRCRGDVIVFLDADDVLERDFAREVAAVWRDGLSKVQVQMRTIDALGNPMGGCFPQFKFVPTPAQVRRWALCHGAYPTPPGSANAYARSFVQQIYPVTNPWDKAADSYLLAAAPVLGEIVTVAKPLVRYRVHGANQGAMSVLQPDRFTKEVQRALDRHAYARRVAVRAGVTIAPTALRRSLWLLPYRLASLRLAPRAHPIQGDNRGRIVLDAGRAALSPQGWATPAIVVLVLWALIVALAPRSMANALVLWRFAPAQRPRWVRTMLWRIGAMRR